MIIKGISNMRNIINYLALISLIITIFSKPARSDNIRERVGTTRTCLSIISVAIPSIEYFSDEDGEQTWGAQFLIEPSFFLKKWGKLNRVYHQIRLSHTFLLKEDDISRFHYAPFLSIFNKIGIGIPLGGYYHAGDFGYSTGLIINVYPIKGFKLFNFIAAYEYRYNPETKNDSYSIFTGIRSTLFFL